MTDNKIVISREGDKIILCHIENDINRDIYAYDSLFDDYEVGTIINGRVEKNLEDIGACFVRIGKKKSGFLNRSLKAESLIPVMYKKPPYKEKKALLTDKISISGQYVVVLDEKCAVHISSKVSEKDKAKIDTESILKKASDCNVAVIVRTAAFKDSVSEADIEEEIEELSKKIQYIRDNYESRPDYYVLYRPELKLIRDCEELCKEGDCEIITDIPEVYDLLKEKYVLSETVTSTDRVSLRFYQDNMLSLDKLYSFKTRISDALRPKVSLRDGVNVVFDQAEALLAVDVNAAGLKPQSGTDETFLKANIMAADEIFRHLRLRNYSGIIIIDFINMKNKDSYGILGEHISVLCRKEKIKTEFWGFTRLGLCELSRQKVQNAFTL